MSRSAEYCFHEVRRHDPERFLCAMFASGPPREDLLAIHAFNLELARVAEAVSEPGLGLIRLQWWREAVAAVCQGKPPDSHPVLQCLATAVARNDLAENSLAAVIDCRTRELTNSLPPPDGDLLALAEASGGALGRLAAMCLPGGREAAAQAAAGHVGMAWALVGLVRATPHNAARNRVLLPQALLDRHGLSADDLIGGKRHPSAVTMVAEMLGLAEQQLAAARHLRRQVGRTVLPALLPAVLAGMHIRRLRRAGHDPAAVPPHLSPLRRAVALLIAGALRQF